MDERNLKIPVRAVYHVGHGGNISCLYFLPVNNSRLWL